MICVPIHFGLVELLVNGFDLGYAGIAIAISLTYSIKTIMFIAIMARCFGCIKERETIQPFSWEDFKGWGEYLKVAVPAMLLQLVEWWSF